MATLSKSTKKQIIDQYHKDLESVLDRFEIDDFILSGDDWYFLREGKAYLVSDKKVIDLGLAFDELPDSIIEEREGTVVKMSVFLNAILAFNTTKDNLTHDIANAVGGEYLERKIEDGVVYHCITTPDGVVMVNLEGDDKVIPS